MASALRRAVALGVLIIGAVASTGRGQVSIPASARVYVLVGSERQGRMTAWKPDDFSTTIVYQFRDRDGCQTDITSTIVVDVVGAPVWERHSGRACRPVRVIDESYTRSGSMGIWKRPSGAGEADVIGKKFYASAADVPEERALLVRALLAAGNELQLMPSGEARIAFVSTMTARAAGRSQAVTAYRITGLPAGPTFVWIDTRGDLFAIDDSLIRDGWEPALDELRRASR